MHDGAVSAGLGSPPLLEWSGLVLEGRFEIRRPLARGAMGALFVAWDRVLEREVAVKALSPIDPNDDPTFMEKRFVAELKILVGLTDPRIVRPLSWGRAENGQLYFITELLEGTSLDRAIENQGPLSAERTARILIDVCYALEEAHGAGVIHRDIKPGNIFLQRSRSGAETARLLDFGVAKVLETDGASTSMRALAAEQLVGPRTMTGILVGTPTYMAPEQLSGNPVDERTDLFSLGLVAFACLTGRRPFEGTTMSIMVALVTQPVPRPSALVPEGALDPDLEGIILRLLAKLPRERPPSAAAVRAQLEAWLARTIDRSQAQPANAVTPTRPARPRPSVPPAEEPSQLSGQQRLRYLLSGSLAALALFILLEGASSKNRPERPSPPPVALAPKIEAVPRMDLARRSAPSEEHRPADTTRLEGTSPAASTEATPVRQRPAPRSPDRVRVTERARVGLGPKMDPFVKSFRRALRACAPQSDQPHDVTLTVTPPGRAKYLVRGPKGAKMERCLQRFDLSALRDREGLVVLSSRVQRMKSARGD